MTLLPGLFLALATAAPPQRAADLCASLQPGAAVSARVVTTSIAAGDTVVRASVCVVPSRAGADMRLGSYHGELHFNPAIYTVTSVEKAGGGVRVENANIAGQLNFAGASPQGLPGRALVTVVLRVRGGQRPALRLMMKELNTTDGRSLMKGLVVAEPPR